MKKITKVLSILLLAALSFSCSNLFDEEKYTKYGSSSSSGSGDSSSTVIPSSLKGLGTEAKPFLIYTIGDLYYFANAMSKKGNKLVAEDGSEVVPRSAYYTLMNDLDFSDAKWMVLSNSYEYSLDFNGVFDGNYHTLKNINSTDGGFFWDMGSSGIVKNLIFDSCNFKKSGWASFSAFGGNVNGTIIGITYSGTVTGGNQILSTGGGTLVGCIVNDSSTKSIGGSTTKGVTRASSGNPETLNAEIASWNSNHENDGKYCNWHFEADETGVMMVKGALSN